MITAALILGLIVLQGLAVYSAWRAVQSARTPQGAIGWVVFLLSAPYIGVLMYAVFGYHRYRGYLLSRRRSELAVRGADALQPNQFATVPPATDPRPFERIADFPALRGNNVRLLVDGEATFQAIFEAIEAATDYVLVQFYIVKDDGLGREFKDRLISAADRGVHVRFMTDAIGSHALPRSYYHSLLQAGIDVAEPRGRPRRRYQINFRNHRKTVVVDGHVGFIGGLNVADDYMGKNLRCSPWRDTHVELHGPVVSQLQFVFAEDWHWAHGTVILDDLFWNPPQAARDAVALIVPTGPADRIETGSLFFFSAIVAARDRIWIATPYCVPDTDILTALKQAALRGVDVRLLIPDVSDVWLTWLAGFAYFDELRDVGVRIWRYKVGFMHQKVVLVDRDLAAVGTTNLDNRSCRLNFEAMAVVFDSAFAAEIEEMFAADIQRSIEVTKTLDEQPVQIRYGAPVARLFAPII